MRKIKLAFFIVMTVLLGLYGNVYARPDLVVTAAAAIPAREECLAQAESMCTCQLCACGECRP